jgi:outer membrane protein assembly factor BamB
MVPPAFLSIIKINPIKGEKMIRLHVSRFELILIVSILLADLALAEDWPRWRGAKQDGISQERGLLKQWPAEGPIRLWTAKLGGGFSSMVVFDGKVCTQTRDKNQEVVVCMDAATGKEIWRYNNDADYNAHPSFSGGPVPESRTGPRATPAVEGDRLYAVGATGILNCLNAKTGEKIWQQDLIQIGGGKVPMHGFSNSPLVEGDHVYINAGGPNGKSIAAINKKDGSLAWQALDDPIGHSSAVWAEIGGVPQVIFFTGIAAVGVAPKEGTLLWRYPWKTTYDLNIATPIYSNGKVFISSNYGSGAAVFSVNDKNETQTVWKAMSMQNHFATPVLYEGNLYGFSENRLRCVDFATGKLVWDQLGLGRGSLTLADGHLILLGDHGQLALAKATPEKYVEISRVQIFDKAILTWTAPVVSGGRLFVRNENELTAFDLRGN